MPDDHQSKLPDWMARLLCAIGAHDFRIVEVESGLGGGRQVRKLECRRCGIVTVRVE